MKNTLLFNTLLMAATALYAGNVSAQKADIPAPQSDKEILFKIHDVKPNKDEEGFVKDCSFTLTVYNRTDTDIEAAAIDLVWPDNDGNYVVAQDIVTDENGDKKFDGRMRTNNKTITTFVDIPQVSSYTQVSVPVTAKTEKCFLLLGTLNYRATSCKMAKRNVMDSASKGKAESCSKMFRYVPINDPEYYKEFKPVSYVEQVSSEEKQKLKDLENIDRINNEILGNFESTKRVLEKIR